MLWPIVQLLVGIALVALGACALRYLTRKPQDVRELEAVNARIVACTAQLERREKLERARETLRRLEADLEKVTR